MKWPLRDRYICPRCNQNLYNASGFSHHTITEELRPDGVNSKEVFEAFLSDMEYAETCLANYPYPGFVIRKIQQKKTIKMEKEDMKVMGNFVISQRKDYKYER